MRWLSGLVIAALCLAATSADAACAEPFNFKFSLGPMVESTPPSELTLGALFIFRSPEPQDNVLEECSPKTFLTVEVAATDDTTSSDQLGIRIQINEQSADQIPNPTGSGFGLLTVKFHGRDLDLDFDLRLSAIDRSGNVGPESVIPVFDEAPGCNAGHRAGAGSLICVVTALGMTVRRRRRFAGDCRR
jgi:hypothetical protein